MADTIKISGLPEKTTIAETDFLVGNVGTGSNATGRIEIDALRTRLNIANQTIVGNIAHTGNQVTSGSMKAATFEGNGALLTGIVAAGTGGTSSASSLSLVCSSDGSVLGEKIALSKYSTPLADVDETGFKVRTGIPYTHEDASIPFDKDINHQGNHLLQSQTIQDIQPAQYAHYNGTTSFSLAPDNIDLEIGTNDASLRLPSFRTPDGANYSGGSVCLFSKRTTTANGIEAGIWTDNKFYFTYDSGTAVTIYSDEVVNDGEWYNPVIRFDRDGLMSIVLSGEPQADTVAIDAVDISNLQGISLAAKNTVTDFFNGDLGGELDLFNYLISADYAKALSSNPNKSIDWADEGGSNTDLTSGTLTVGKKYRTETFVAGDDFSNVADTGASANVTGAEWTATGTTPTTWTNSSVLHQIGCTFRYKGADMTTGYLFDSSGNGNHASNTDVSIGNASRQDYELPSTFTPANGDFGTWTSPTFTATEKKRGSTVFVSITQTGGTIDPGAAGKYFTGLTYTPSAIATAQATNGAFADLGAVIITTAKRLYFSDDIGPTTTLSLSFTYETNE